MYTDKMSSAGSYRYQLVCSMKDLGKEVNNNVRDAFRIRRTLMRHALISIVSSISRMIYIPSSEVTVIIFL